MAQPRHSQSKADARAKASPSGQHPSGDRVSKLSSRTLHAGRVFRLDEEHVRLASGLEQKLDVVVHPGAVCVLAELSPGRVVAVRQYRHAVGATLTEIPAGRLDPAEDPETAARRELEEETGWRAKRWSLVFDFVPAPGFCSERLHLFFAQDLERAGADRLAADEDEEIEVLELDVSELLGIEPRDAKTWMAASWYLHHREHP